MSKHTAEARRHVEKPFVELQRPGGRKIRLWVLDAGQYAHLADSRQFQFYAGKTASLIYEGISVNGHYATEYPLDNAETWAWIQKWMRIGLQSADILQQLVDTANLAHNCVVLPEDEKAKIAAAATKGQVILKEVEQ